MVSDCKIMKGFLVSLKVKMTSIIKNNIFATQFHPEKSADKGISIYKNWALINKLL